MNIRCHDLLRERLERREKERWIVKGAIIGFTAMWIIYCLANRV